MGKDQKFFKRNFVDAIEIVTPGLYKSRDLALSGKALSPVAQLINGDISFVDKFRKLLGPTSALPGTEFATVDTPEGFSNFFVKQNNLTEISPASFESDILKPLGTQWTDFTSSAQFEEYLAETLLPIVSPSGTGFPANFYTVEGSEAYANSHKFGTTASAVHLHFLRSLGLFYLLNRERPTDTYNIFTDQRSWFSDLNWQSDVFVPGFEGPPVQQAGPDTPGGTGVVPNSQRVNNPLRFNWESPASTVSLWASGLDDDPFGRNNTTRVTLKTPDWSLPPQACYCEINEEPAINLNENECYEAGGAWRCPEEGEQTLGERTGAALRYKHNIEHSYATEGSIYFSFWARLKHFSASDLNTNPLNNGQKIRVTHMGNGKAGPNWTWAITPTWQQICMRAYEGYGVNDNTKGNKKVCKYFILPKWTDSGHGSGGEVFNGPPEPNFWQEGDEIELAYPASYIASLESGKSAVEYWRNGELHKIAPDISQHDYLKFSPSGGYGFGSANVDTTHNDWDFLAWDSENPLWADLTTYLLNRWVTSKTRYVNNGAGFNIPGTRGRPAGAGGGAGGSPGSDDPDSALGGNASLLIKDSGETLSPAGLRHDLVLTSAKDYKLTVYLAKQGQHYEPTNNDARQVVSLVEFSFSRDWPTSVGPLIDSGHPGAPVLDNTLAYHRLWINWSPSANEIEDVFSETHNTNVTDYSIEDMGGTGWYKVTLDLTIDRQGHFRDNPGACKGMITVYPSRNYFRNGLDYSRYHQDPLVKEPTVRRGRVSVGRVYLTEPSYDIPDDYSAYGELYEWSYVKRNTDYKIWEGPNINSYDPSSTVLKNFVKLYKGETLTTLDAVKAVEDYVWNNYFGTGDPYGVKGSSDPIGVDPNYGKVRGMRDIEHTLIPDNYLSGTGEFEQGNQNLDNLQTLNDVVYSPLYLDKNDTMVKQSLNTYFTLGKMVSDKEAIGPLHRFLQALGFISFDINNQIESIRTLTSLQECPSSLLPYLANIIGWKLYGTDENSWRRQLWNATELYKKKGSLAGLEQALDVVMPDNPILFKGQLDPDISQNYLADIDLTTVLDYGDPAQGFIAFGAGGDYITSVFGVWGNKSGLLKPITRPEDPPYGSQKLGRFWAKDQYSTPDDSEPSDSYLTQDYDLYNQQAYTFSVFLKYVPYRNEEHFEQKSSISIKYPNTGPTFSETTLAIRWNTSGAQEGSPSAVASFARFNVPNPEGGPNPYAPTNLHSSSLEDVGDGWWRLGASLKINPLGDPKKTTATRFSIRPGGGGLDSEDPEPPIDDCIYGCMDPEAINYSDTATCDDGTCEYDGGEEPCTNNNECPGNQICVDGVCQDPPRIGGCTDPFACNTNYDADYDDGSCDYDSCFGCTDPEAANYDEYAIYDDGTCVFWGGPSDPSDPPVLTCTSDDNCPGNQICVDGVCQDPPCLSDNDCPGDQVCIDGTCHDPPQTGTGAHADIRFLVDTINPIAKGHAVQTYGSVGSDWVDPCQEINGAPHPCYCFGDDFQAWSLDCPVLDATVFGTEGVGTECNINDQNCYPGPLDNPSLNGVTFGITSADGLRIWYKFSRPGSLEKTWVNDDTGLPYAYKTAHVGDVPADPEQALYGRAKRITQGDIDNSYNWGGVGVPPMAQVGEWFNLIKLPTMRFPGYLGMTLLQSTADPLFERTPSWDWFTDFTILDQIGGDPLVGPNNRSYSQGRVREGLARRLLEAITTTARSGQLAGGFDPQNSTYTGMVNHNIWDTPEYPLPEGGRFIGELLDGGDSPNKPVGASWHNSSIVNNVKVPDIINPNNGPILDRLRLTNTQPGPSGNTRIEMWRFERDTPSTAQDLDHGRWKELAWHPLGILHDDLREFAEAGNVLNVDPVAAQTPGLTWKFIGNPDQAGSYYDNIAVLDAHFLDETEPAFTGGAWDQPFMIGELNSTGETGAAYVWNPMVNVGSEAGLTVGKTDRPLNKTYAEYYESYIPRLLHYLLQTDSTFFKDGNKWSEKLSDNFQINEYSPADTTTNINYIVDHILKKAVGKFHDHFYISYMPFDVNITEDDEVYLGPAHQMVDGRWMTGKTHTPKDKYLKRIAGTTYTDKAGDLIYGMAFNYRGRDFPIPPWEEEKFYINCEVSNDLLDFFEEELVIFGVSETRASEFRDYTAQRTCEGEKEFKAFNNSFLFFTSSLELPPNHEEIIATFDESKFDYLSMWNGKSSTFDVNVSAGTFDSDLFRNVPYNSDDFFEALGVVDDFSPAKATPRTNAHLFGVDEGGGLDSICKGRTYSYDELLGDLSSVLGGYSVSSVEMRASSLGGIGGAANPSYNFEGYGGANNHRYLPVFSRDQVSRLEDALIQGTSSVYPVSSANVPFTGEVGGPSATATRRNSARRRNYHNLLPTANWYKRDGFNMPTFLNTKELDFNPLGFIASSWKFEDVSSISDYPAVWGSCQDNRSTTEYYGIKGTKTFPVRLSSEFQFDECTNYQNRGQLAPMIQTINSIIERRADLEAQAIYELNKYNFDISGSWYDPISVAKGSLTFGAEHKDYTDFSMTPEFQRLYKDYTNQMDKHTLASNRLDDYVDGGPNIFSHIYGPLYFNGALSIAGSAVEDTSSNLIASSVETEYIISLNASSNKINYATNESNIGTAVASSVTDLFVGSYEFRNPHILSGVELVDTSSAAAHDNQFSLFKYTKESAKKYTNQFLNTNGIVVMRSVKALPRLRLSLKDYDQTKDAENKTNFLLPDHEFKLTISSIFGRDRINSFGGGSMGAWVHTKPEYDSNNDLVFWYWSREHDWKIQKVSDVSGLAGITQVKSSYAHIFNYPQITSIQAPEDSLSFYDVSGKPTINLVKDRDLNKSELKFNTNNKDVTVPISYYKQHGQLHRKDQDYTVEVFPFPSPSKDLYCLIDDISVIDITQRDRIKLPHSFTAPDFTPSLNKTPDKYEFYYSDGERAPLNTKVYFDSEGSMTAKYKDDIDKITLGITRADNTKTLYTQVSALDPSSYFTSVSSIPDFGYVRGWFMKTDSNSLDPSSVSARGLTAGTHTQKDITANLELLPEELITILRYYNDIATANASRIAANTSGVFETSGGSRASYRNNPMWDGSAIILESGQYSSVDLDN